MVAARGEIIRGVKLTAKSETKLHCCMGWLYVGSVLTRERVNVSPGWSVHITADDAPLPENRRQKSEFCP